MSQLKFVFCEDGDDVAVVRGVAALIALPDIRIEPFLGKNNLPHFLRDIKTRPEFAQNKVAAIGILRDADDDDVGAFRSVCDALTAHGFGRPNSNGGFASGDVRVGVLVIGPKNGKGMIEDLCLNSVSDLPQFGCVDEYFQCIVQKGGWQQFSSKAKVRAWMASQLDYELYVGKAAEKGYWNWASPVFDAMKEFLKQL
jgi:hypothetical protein